MSAPLSFSPSHLLFRLDNGLTHSARRNQANRTAEASFLPPAPERFLLQPDAVRSPQSPPPHGVTASARAKAWHADLENALNSGQATLIRQWLATPERQAAVHAYRNALQNTALTQAACRGQSDIVRLLVENFGMDVNQLDGKHHAAWSYALHQRHLHTFKTLLALGVDANKPSKNGNTPLHYVAYYNRLEAAQLLLQHGANPALRNDFGERPADLARKWRHHVIAALLTPENSPATGKNMPDEPQKPALDRPKDQSLPETALLSRERMAASSSLQDARPVHSPGWAANSEVSPLKRLIRERQNDALASLLRNGEDGEAMDDQGRRPLHWAVQSGNLAALALLLAAGVNVNAADHRKNTPLQLAVELETSPEAQAILKTLLRQGARPNLQNADGDTALHRAIDRNDPFKCQVLAQHPDTDLMLTDGNGESPLMKAVRLNQAGVAKAILKAYQQRRLNAWLQGPDHATLPRAQGFLLKDLVMQTDASGENVLKRVLNQAQRGPAEQRMAALWQRMLGIEPEQRLKLLFLKGYYAGLRLQAQPPTMPSGPAGLPSTPEEEAMHLPAVMPPPLPTAAPHTPPGYYRMHLPHGQSAFLKTPSLQP